MSQNRYINPETISKPTGYTHVVETRGNRTIYISGQVPLDKDGNLIGEGDMQAQTEQVFKNLQAALASVGATFEDVVKLGFYLTDMRQLPVVRTIRNQYLHPDKAPASTAVEVRSLFREDVLIEIEAIAVLDE